MVTRKKKLTLDRGPSGLIDRDDHHPKNRQHHHAKNMLIDKLDHHANKLN